MGKKKIIIGGSFVVLALAFLLFRLTSLGTPSYTVSQLALNNGEHQSTAANPHVIQVAGKVLEGSVQQNVRAMTLRFSITDIESGQGHIPVYYTGAPPDTFKTGNDILVEGYLDESGVFQASKLSPKCPSRYVPAG